MLAPRSLLTATLLLGCRPTPTPSPPATDTMPSAEPPPRATSDAPPASAPRAPLRYVMLWDGATLASGFDSSADTARAFDAHPRRSTTARYWILRVVVDHGEFYEVQTTEDPRARPHCVLPLTAFDGYALRLYVRKDEAVTVTTREVSVTLPGGDRVTLSPGVRVIPPPSPGQPTRIQVDPELDLALPPDSIGHPYLAPTHYDDGESIGSLRLDALRLDGAIDLPRRVGASIYERRDDGDESIVTLADGCVRYELRVPSASIEDPLGFGYGSGSGRDPAPRYTIAADAPIWWTNGEPAGTTRRRVPRYDEPLRTEPGRICFAHFLSANKGSPDPVLTLCFDAADVQAVRPTAEPVAPPTPASG